MGTPTSPLRFRPVAPGLLRSTAVGPDPAPCLVLPPAVTDPTTALGLSDSWATGGAYLFLGAPLPRDAAFAGAVRSLLGRREWIGTRLLWLRNPGDAAAAWRLCGIRVHAGTPTGARVSCRADLRFGSYTLVVDGGLALTLDTATSSFVLGGPGPDGFRLSARNGARSIPLTGPATLAMTGAAAGTLVLDGSLPVGTAGADLLEAMDAACRFFHPDPDVPHTGSLTSQAYPVLDLRLPASTSSAATVGLRWQLDPAAPLSGERTRADVTTPDAIRSHYRTALGSPVELTPLTAGLRLATRPASAAATADDALYLVHDGEFAVGVAGPERSPALLCGVSGAEYVELPGPTADTRLGFLPGAPALAGDFDPVQTTRMAGGGPRLQPAPTTSWAAVTASAPVTYFAQPEGATLFGSGPDAPAAPATARPLPYFDVATATVPARGARPTLVYPLVAHAGATDDLAARERLEVQVLSQQRREVMHSYPVEVPPPEHRLLADGAAPPPALTAATPQGLIAGFSSDRTRWTALDVARSLDPAAPGGTRLLTLHDVGDPLRSALLTNQQFLVISDPTVFGRYLGADGELVVDGWHFDLDPARWAVHGTVMIVKNARKPLVELMADPTTWVLGSVFNRDPAAVARKLQAVANDAEAQDGDDFRPFRALLADASWNGVLFLDAFLDLDAGGLPPQLAGLAAGIDPAVFRAHHLGIDQSAVAADLTMHPSSMFGLIHYADPRRLASSGFDFRVASLTVRFAASAVVSFASRIRIALNELFATPVSRTGDPAEPSPNLLELDGVYQHQGDSGTYVFSETTPTLFRPVAPDRVLRSVRIVRATFATLVDPPGTAAGPTVASVFTFWGELALAELTVGAPAGSERMPFDLLSYDMLVFAGLQLHMDLPRATPAARSFRFDPSPMTFDARASRARAQSLAAHFPVTPAGMLASGSSATPGAAGYMTVNTDLDTAAITAPWFALRYDLDLGTAGDLAGSVGFTASLAVSWAPRGDRSPVGVGLKLPGSNSARDEITLEGVLKIKIYSISLGYESAAFLLKLNGIALTFLGKSLPPGGSFDLFVFGDPDPSPGAGRLGWYGAYQKDPATTG